MDDAMMVQCPYCFEWIELWIDPDTSGQMIEDCEICCRPWRVHVDREAGAEPRVFVERAQ